MTSQNIPDEGADFAAPSGFIPVDSVEEEYAYLSQHPCKCRGRWELQMQALLNIPNCPPEYLFDRLDVKCASCGTSASFVFRVNATSAAYKKEGSQMEAMLNAMMEDEETE